MYPYHNRIKQRIRAGEMIGYHYTEAYPRIGRCLVLEFDRPPLLRPVREYRWPEYQEILENWEKQRKECSA